MYGIHYQVLVVRIIRTLILGTCIYFGERVSVINRYITSGRTSAAWRQVGYRHRLHTFLSVRYKVISESPLESLRPVSSLLMPPFQQRSRRKGPPSDSSTVATTEASQSMPSEAAASPSPSPPSPPSNGELNKQRKASRLIGMVNGLQKSMETMITRRTLYAKRSIDLEQALEESAPEALSNSINIRTIQIADIMIELEDLNEKIASQEEQIQKLRHGQEREKQTMQVRLEQLMSRYERLEDESLQKQTELNEKLAEANTATEAIQQKYASTRQSYHTLTRNIAMMASKLAGLQRENVALRVEADGSHKALVEMERKVETLQQQNATLQGHEASTESNKPRPSSSFLFVDLDEEESDSLQQLQLQLNASKFENEKLIAERTANESVIAELRNQVQELQASLEAQRKSTAVTTTLNGVSSSAAHATPPSARARANASVLRDVPSYSMGQLEETEKLQSKLDGLLGTVRSMSKQSFLNSCRGLSSTSGSQPEDSHSASVAVPQPAAPGEKSEASPTSPSPVRTVASHASSPTKARRMKIVINGMEGSYTGPLSTNGLPNGTGTIRFRNGDTYLGEVEDGRLHGKGTMYTKGKALVRNQLFQDNVPVE